MPLRLRRWARGCPQNSAPLSAGGAIAYCRTIVALRTRCRAMLAPCLKESPGCQAISAELRTMPELGAGDEKGAGSSEMKRLLEEGFSYEEIILTSDYFSPRFCRCFSLGYQSDSLDSLLPLYLQREITLWQKQADRFGALIQLFVYAVIGLLVFSVYQLLLTPLEMLNQM